MKKWGLVVASVVMASSAAADVVGLRAGVSGWNGDFKGTVQSGPEPIDLNAELGFADENYASAYVSFEHPIPLIPAVRLGYVGLSQDSEGVLRESFRGIAFDGATTSTLDLTQADLTAYWELLDNVVSLDLGVQTKFVTGEFSLQGATAGGVRTTQLDIEETLPMLYVGVGADLPLTGLGLYASVAGTNVGDNSGLDATAKISYDIKLLGFEAGWRELRLNFDKLDGVDAEYAVRGPFVGLNLHF